MNPTTREATEPGREGFSALAEVHRRELQVHCYRMVGSLDEAEDLVQETMLRAWRSRDGFEDRASLRTWLYKIATNACLDALEKRSRRSLPQAKYPPANLGEPFAPPVAESAWLEPYPDEWLPDGMGSPEARYTAAESISLAFQVALQALPARQRAVLILRDVLDWRASEVAQVLDTTASAVNSMLHRARETLLRRRSTEWGRGYSTALDKQTRSLLDRYVEAWESANVEMLVSMLTEDAILAMPPTPSWYRGPEAIAAVLRDVAFADGPADRWRFRRTAANGQPAFVYYLADASTGEHQGAGVQVLSFDRSSGGPRVSEIVAYMLPQLVAKFGLPHDLGE